MAQIKASRRDTIEALKAAAEEAGDDDAVAALNKGVSSAQWSKVTKAMGMIRSVTGRQYDSDQTMRKLIELTVNSKSKRSIISLAAQIINDLGLGDEDAVEKLSERYTAAGSTRVAWKKAHRNRK